MGIGILYESKEWSSYTLEKKINDMGVEAKLVDMQGDVDESELLTYELIVNRMPGSAGFRGHQKALDRMPGVIDLLKKNGVPMLNTYDAYFYETSKERSTKTLESLGFSVPKVYGVFPPARMTENADIEYPCIVKPDCGGRTNCTYIVRNYQDLRASMKTAPDIPFIAEEYIYPEYGYLTRIEVIGGVCRSILKRSVAENGLSAYRMGSTYAEYPDVADKIKTAAVKVMELLQIEMGSMDVVENQSGFYFIDINAVSNASEESVKATGFDLITETADYVVKKYKELISAS